MFSSEVRIKELKFPVTELEIQAEERIRSCTTEGILSRIEAILAQIEKHLANKASSK